MFTKTFGQLGKNDAAIAGGKGALLGEMTGAGIPVPPGFVLLAGAFERFLEETDLNVEIDSVLHTVNHHEMHTVENASEKIQALILTAQMPKDIALETRKEFRKLHTKFVAVRSSATAEDSANAAWAGELDSFLNTTEKNLLDNVKKCWASLFTPRAIFYRHEKGLHKQKIGVAVVVQKMVESAVSGIAFSVHPVTEDRNQMIIEAGFGLGEAIVSGQITPDSYVVEKQPRRIIDKNISEQNYSLIRTNKRIDGNGMKGGGGGNMRVVLSKEKGGKQKLSDQQILELSELVLKIERHYGFPCDIEWASACPSEGLGKKGQFSVLQSRPITTLSKNPPAASRKPSRLIVPKKFIRDFPLILCQIWGRRYKHIFGKDVQVFPRNIFVFHNGLVTLYRGPTVNHEINTILLAELKRDRRFVKRLVQSYLRKIHTLKAKCSKVLKHKEFLAFLDLVFDCWQSVFVSLYVPLDERFAKSDFDLAMDFRRKTDNLEYDAFNHIDTTLKELYGDLGDLARFISLEELTANAIPSSSVLSKRQKGLLLVDDEVVTESEFKKLQKQFNFELEVENTPMDAHEIKGEIACSGRVVGTVRILMKNQDVSLLEKREILVTSMTVPTFLPAMERAAAFVTDEGGITCHAAIVARELKKPCIIGTKIATKVLKDGDVVEVDAEKGIVRKL